jgi:hypothetical protein
MDERLIRGEVAAELSRRQFLQRAGALGAGAMVVAALPAAARMLLPEDAVAQDPIVTDPTLQAFFDTIIPGRPATATDLGNTIYPGAIAGVDSEPGAVEADALLLSHHPKIGFDALEPAFLAELEAFALQQVPPGPFISLDYAHREAVCVQGLAFSNPSRVVWEAAAAVPFTAFCAAATQINPTSATASGYAVMGHPGIAPSGYSDFSYGQALATELTEHGYLP